MDKDHLQETLTDIKESLQSLEHLIRGNGADGLITRVALLEQKDRARQRLLYAMSSIVVALSANLAWGLMSG